MVDPKSIEYSRIMGKETMQDSPNDDAEIFWKTNTKTVEGVEACRIICTEARELGISMPITEQLYQVLFEHKKPSEAIYQLMTRSLKEEE